MASTPKHPDYPDSSQPQPGWDKVVVSSTPMQFWETTYGSADGPSISPEAQRSEERDQNAPGGGSRVPKKS